MLRLENEDRIKESKGMVFICRVRDNIGRDLFPKKGVVRVDQYDEAKSALLETKDQVLDRHTHPPPPTCAHDAFERKLWEDD